MMKYIIVLVLAAICGQAVGFTSNRVRRSSLTAVHGMANIIPDVKTSYSETITGKVYFRQTSTNSLPEFRVILSGLNSLSVHGIHIHEYVDVVTNGCKSTGEDYNPHSENHGGPLALTRHVGDIGNVKADVDGKVDVKFTDTQAVLIDDDSIIGRTFVVHQNRDDFGHGAPSSSGNSGEPISCGPIGHAPTTEVNNAFDLPSTTKGSHIKE